MKRLLPFFLALFLSLALVGKGWAVDFASLSNGQITVEFTILAGGITALIVQNTSSTKTAKFSTILLGKETVTVIGPNTSLRTISITSIAIVEGLAIYLGAK